MRIFIKIQKNFSKLCRFLEIPFDKNMINPEKWKKILKNRFFYLNESAYDQKQKSLWIFFKKEIINGKITLILGK